MLPRWPLSAVCAGFHRARLFVTILTVCAEVDRKTSVKMLSYLSYFNFFLGNFRFRKLVNNFTLSL